MAAARPAAGGGRTVEVPPERLDRWISNFAERHGAVEADSWQDGLVLTAADGATARFDPAFPPLPQPNVRTLLQHATTDRRIGLILVRLGGHAVGIFEGRTLIVSKVGSRQVHGRSAAGGWSQQRFARRRVGQVAVAHDAAADVVVRILLPELATLEALVTGGDKVALSGVLGDKRLEVVKPLVTARVLDVGDPKRAVLEAAVDAARATVITVTD